MLDLAEAGCQLHSPSSEDAMNCYSQKLRRSASLQDVHELCA